MPLSLCSLNTSLRITFSTEFGVIWLAWILFPFLSFGGRLSTWYLHLDHLYYSLDVVNKFSHFSLLGSYSKAPEYTEYDALRIIFDTKCSFRLTRKAHSLSIHGTQPMQNPNIYWIWRKKIRLGASRKSDTQKKRQRQWVSAAKNGAKWKKAAVKAEEM